MRNYNERNYNEPNFIAQRVGEDTPRLYLVRCYECEGFKDHCRENWAPQVADGSCAWCQWKPDPEAVARLYKERS